MAVLQDRNLGLARKRGSRDAVTIASDESAVRRYLRALAGAPEVGSDSVLGTEAAFVKAIVRWSQRSGVDYRTLREFGVPKSTLDAAGLKQPDVAQILRPYFTVTPFDVATIARRACVPVAPVRAALNEQTLAGRLRPVESGSATHQWSRVRT